MENKEDIQVEENQSEVFEGREEAMAASAAEKKLGGYLPAFLIDPSLSSADYFTCTRSVLPAPRTR
jgi:hypothetical protein